MLFRTERRTTYNLISKVKYLSDYASKHPQSLIFLYLPQYRLLFVKTLLLRYLSAYLSLLSNLGNHFILSTNKKNIASIFITPVSFSAKISSQLPTFVRNNLVAADGSALNGIDSQSLGSCCFCRPHLYLIDGHPSCWSSVELYTPLQCSIAAYPGNRHSLSCKGDAFWTIQLFKSL